MTREYGTSGPDVVVLHGGPGAPGYLAPLARTLADTFRILEPFQRGSSQEPLSVARHIADLQELIISRCGERRPAIVGHSWGAMLALAHAAAHPDSLACLVLIGCGTFDPASRIMLETNRKKRMDDKCTRQTERLHAKFPDPDKCLLAMGSLFQRIDSYDLVTVHGKTEPCDARAHEETWQDMMQLQDSGVYPASFANITVPAIMLHGVNDPHPGHMIHANLKSYVPQLEYKEWEQCGHYPWLEKAAKDDFITTLHSWLLQNKARTTSSE